VKRTHYAHPASKHQEMDSAQSEINKVKNAIAVEDIDVRVYTLSFFYRYLIGGISMISFILFSYKQICLSSQFIARMRIHNMEYAIQHETLPL
jgi:hypothetical protein